MRAKVLLFVGCALFLWRGRGETTYVESSLLPYLQRIGVIADDGSGYRGVVNRCFFSVETVRDAQGVLDSVVMTRKCESNEVDKLLHMMPSALCAGQGRTGVVFGSSCSDGDPQMYVFGKCGLVAGCRREGTGVNTKVVVECRMSSEVRDMMQREGCAKHFPDRLLGLEFKSSPPKPESLTEDKTVVMNGSVPCSASRCRDARAVMIDHPVFTDIRRVFEKESMRMISFELRRTIDSKEDLPAICHKIWRDLLLAGFYGGRVEKRFPVTQTFGFKRIDDITASLQLYGSETGMTQVSLTIDLPEEFETRHAESRRHNGWRDPRIVEF